MVTIVGEIVVGRAGMRLHLSVGEACPLDKGLDRA